MTTRPPSDLAAAEEFLEALADLAEADGEDLDLDGDGHADAPNDLAAARYALSLGLPVLEWRALRRAEAAAGERIERAARLWSGRARALLAAYQAGLITAPELIAALKAEFAQQARNAFVAGLRAVGDLEQMDAEDQAALDDEIGDDLGFLDRYGQPAAAGGGAAALISGMLFDPSNYLGSGLPGDPFAGLPAPIGAGHNAAWRAEQEARKAAGAAGGAIDQAELARRAEREATAAGRVEQYADRMHGISKRGEMRGLSGLPGQSVVVWWTLGIADHCVDCVRLAAGSPYYLSALEEAGLHPGSGHTRCGGHCRCHFEYDTPAIVCADGVADGGLSGLVESAGRLEAFVQEAATCAVPMDVASLYPGDFGAPIAYDEPFTWDQDVAASMVDSGKELAWSAVKKDADMAAALGWLLRDSPDGLRLYTRALEADLRVRVLAHPTTGARFAYAYRLGPKRLTYEAGIALDGGSTLLDVEFTLRALQDLGARAAASGRDLAVEGATASPGMRRWLQELGAPLEPDGLHERYVIGQVPQGASHLPAIPSGDLPKVGDLGGSTGARLVEDPATGKRYVDKAGASAGHVREESAADRAYEAMGVPVAPHVLLDTPSGPLKRAEYQDGAVDLATFLKTASPADAAAVLGQVQDGLALDALLANWDVVGLGGDNILVRNGVALRIDNGGSLRYRAQGALKGDKFGDQVTELARLRDTSKGAWPGQVFGGVTDARAREQVLALDANRQALLAALPADLRGKVGKRLDSMLEQTKTWGPVDTAPALDLLAAQPAAGVLAADVPALSAKLTKENAAWAAALPDAQREALKNYKLGFADEINDSLRGVTSPGVAGLQAILGKEVGFDLPGTIRALDAAIAGAPPRADALAAVVYRGRALDKLPAVGDLVHDAGYTSATIDPGQAGLFAMATVSHPVPVVYRLGVPSDHPAVWTDAHFSGDAAINAEAEVLLPRGMSWRVAGVEPGTVVIPEGGPTKVTIVDLVPEQPRAAASAYAPDPPGVQSWKPGGDPALADMPGSPIPLNAPLQPPGLGTFQEPALPDLGLTKAELDAARAAAKAVRSTVEDVAGGKAPAVWLTSPEMTTAAKAAGLGYDKVGEVRFATALGDTATSGPIREYLEKGGLPGTEEWFALLGHEPGERDALIAWEEAKAGARSLRAGVMVVEPDGRVWLMSPKGHYGGYENTWSKGGVDAGETVREAAVREAREEMGLSVDLTGYLGDFENAEGTSVTRYYVARRTGGGPALGDAKETGRVKLAAPDDARPLLIHNGKPDPRDVAVLDAYVAGPAYVAPAGAIPLPATVPDPAAIAAGLVEPPPASVKPELDEFVRKISPPRPDPRGGAPSPVPGPTSFAHAPAIDPPASEAFGYDYGAVQKASQNAGSVTAGNATTLNVVMAGGAFQDHVFKTWGDELEWGLGASTLDPGQRMAAYVAGLDRLGGVVSGDAAYATVIVSPDLVALPAFADLLVAAGAQTSATLGYRLDREHFLDLWHAVGNDAPLALPEPHIPTGAMPGPAPSALAASADAAAQGTAYVSHYDPSTNIYAVDMHLHGGMSAADASALLKQQGGYYQDSLVNAITGYGPTVAPELFPVAPPLRAAPSPAQGAAAALGPPGAGVVAPGVLSSTYGVDPVWLEDMAASSGVTSAYAIKGSPGFKTRWQPEDLPGAAPTSAVTVTWDVNKGAIRWYGVTGVKKAGDTLSVTSGVAQLDAWRAVLAAQPELAGVRLTMLQEMPATWKQLLLDAGGVQQGTANVVSLTRQQVDDLVGKFKADAFVPAPPAVLGPGPIAQKYGIDLAGIESHDLPWTIKGKPYTRTEVTIEVEDLGQLSKRTARVDWAVQGGEIRWYGASGQAEAKMHAGAEALRKMAVAAEADPAIAAARITMLPQMPPEWQQLLLDAGATWDGSILRLGRDELAALRLDLEGAVPAGAALPPPAAVVPPPHLGAKYGHDEALAMSPGFSAVDAPIDVKGKPFTASAYAADAGPTVKVIWNVNADHELRWYQVSGGGGAGGDAARHAAAVRQVVKWADIAASDASIVGARFSMLQQLPDGFRQMLLDYGAVADKTVLRMDLPELHKLAADLRLDMKLAQPGLAPAWVGPIAPQMATAKAWAPTWESLGMGDVIQAPVSSLDPNAGGSVAIQHEASPDKAAPPHGANVAAYGSMTPEARGASLLAGIARWVDEADLTGADHGIAVYLEDAIKGGIADALEAGGAVAKGDFLYVPAAQADALAKVFKAPAALPAAAPAGLDLSGHLSGLGIGPPHPVAGGTLAQGAELLLTPAGDGAMVMKVGPLVTILKPPALSNAHGNAEAIAAALAHALDQAPGSTVQIQKSFAAAATGWTDLLKAAGAKSTQYAWELTPAQAGDLAAALKALPIPVAKVKPVLGVDLNGAATVQFKVGGYNAAQKTPDWKMIASAQGNTYATLHAQVDFETVEVHVRKSAYGQPAGTYLLATYTGPASQKAARSTAGVEVMRQIVANDPGLTAFVVTNADVGRFGWATALKKEYGLAPTKVNYYSKKLEWRIEGPALDKLKADLGQAVTPGAVAPGPAAVAGKAAPTPMVSKPIPLAAPGASPASAVLPPDAQVAASLGYDYAAWVKVADKGAAIAADRVTIVAGAVQHTGTLTLTPSGGTVVWSRFATTGSPEEGLVGSIAMLRALADDAQSKGKKLYVATGNAANAFPPGVAELLEKAGSTKGYGGAVTAYGEGWLLDAPQAKKLVEALNVDTFEADAIANAVASPRPLVWPSAENLTLKSGKAGERVIFTDSAGAEWWFKPSPTGRAAKADAVAQELADTLGLNVAPVRDYTLEVGGQRVEGTLQKMIPKGKSIAAAGELTDKQLGEAMQHQVLDWATGSSSSLDSFVRDDAGRLWGIDKATAFRALRTPLDSLDAAADGLPSLATSFWRDARTNPALLARVHPRDYAATLRRLRNIDDAEYRRLMGPVAADWRQYPAFRSEKDMLDALVARKASAPADFDAFLSRQVKEATAVNPGAVPDEWRVWLASGGHLNLDATARDLWQESRDALNAEFGPYSAQSAKAIQAAQYRKAQSLLSSYTNSGLKSQAQKKGLAKATGTYGVEFLPLLTPAQEYEQFRKLQQWTILNIVSGAAGPVRSDWDNYLRKYWNPETGTFRFKRQTTHYGDAAATLKGYQAAGTRPMLSFAVPEGSWHGAYVYVEVSWEQVYAAFAAHDLFLGHTSEIEVMLENIRPDQIIHVRDSHDPLTGQELIDYAGPLLASGRVPTWPTR